VTTSLAARRVDGEAPLVVLKFGGTCVASEASRASVADRIVAATASGWRVAVVVSAMGRRGSPYATDTLLDLVARECPGAADADRAVAYICGELLSAALVSGLLRSRGVAAACLSGWQAGIITNECTGDAEVVDMRPQRVLDLLAEGSVPVVAGSQGATAAGAPTSLGRGGSDTTATALGVALAADRVEIFTDTPGILTADPAMVPSARPLAAISHRACERFAALGAKVIHAKAVRLAALRPEMPVIVRSLGEDSGQTQVGNQGWLPSMFGRPLGVTCRPAENATARVSLVFEQQGAPAAAPGLQQALAANGIAVLQWHCEDDCLSAWVPAEQSAAALRALHALAFAVCP